MKKFILMIMMTAMLLTALPLFSSAEAAPDPSEIGSRCACVYNIENDEYLFKKNTEEIFKQGNTVKIMTAALAIEHYSSGFDVNVTVTPEMAASIKETGGHINGFKEGESVPVESLVAAVIVDLSNDASIILAYSVAGSIPAFIDMMNRKAAELGMQNTVFDSVTGYGSVGSTSNVEDLVKLCRYACSLYKFTELSDLPRYDITVSEKLKKLYNRNYFISYWYNKNYIKSNVYGLNAGYYGQSGSHVIAVSSTGSGLSYLTLAMNAPNDEDTTGESVCYNDAEKLMEWAENNFGYVTIVDSSQMICEIPVKLSANYDHVALLPKEKISAFLPLDTDLKNNVDIKYTLDSNELYAPVIEEKKVGQVSAYIDGKLIGQSDLVAKSNIEGSFWLLLGSNCVSVIKSTLFITIAAVLILIIILYIIINAKRSAKNKKARKKKNRLSR